MKISTFYFLLLLASMMLISSCEFLEPPKTPGWSCNGGCCDLVDDNADYTNLIDCENACNWFPLVDYMVWTDVDLGCFPVEVKMIALSGGVDQAAYLTSKIIGGSPECGDSGPANFNILPGLYDIEATCSSGKTWTKRVSVSKVCCSGWKIN